MLGKLLKYDLKFVYKVVIVFYILAVIFSVIGRGLSLIENSVMFNVISQIAFSFAISMIVSSLINCLMRLWARMVKNMYKDESYLTHTLPVDIKTIYLSKVIAAIITIFTTTLVAILCLFICYYSEANMELLKTLLEIAATTYNTTVLNLLLLVSVVIFLEIIYILLIGYIGIILGHKYNGKKMLKSIIIGFAIYMLMQFLTLGILYCYGMINPQVMNLMKTTSTIEIDAIKSVMYSSIGIYAVYVIAIYIFGMISLKKGVNVE